MTNILIIDDEREVGNFLTHLLSGSDCHVFVGYSGEDAKRLIIQRQYQLAMIDVMLPDTSGLKILRKIKEQMPQCKTIIMTGYSTVKTAVEAIKLGANDYIEKPFDDIDQLEKLIKQLFENTTPSNQSTMFELAERTGFIVGENQSMKQLVTMAHKMASKNINVLIEGETGTGKEVLATYIHHASQRKDQPFIAVNCGALSETLLESELFGHEKGAFTGAVKEKKGIFELASKGTLFLDEIGEASLSIQVKLLRVLETGEFFRVGGESVKRTHTRILAASHVNLAEAVQEKKFREDLLYRLDVVKLTIPPLRERMEDIPLLISFLLKKYQSDLTFSTEALRLIQRYKWFGNIRELSNMVKRAITLAEDEGSLITPAFLPEKLLSNETISISETSKDLQASSVNDFETYLREWNKRLLSLWQEEKEVDLEIVLNDVKELEAQIGKAFVTKMLRETIGDRREAAKRLNISMRKLRYLLNEKKQQSPIKIK
ncbi:sigma-54-dependent transcriptional regulator [Halalkalibacter nanhaiisediminis]|uniref:Two-component system NtrC family response regulator n=1 Tax=Halalkalibacter nanhaiisediminis TaxID=688079 RepID=A0A562QLR2_9BACI|nr:sigma-54 dependent transcriptional regulator [Halalkalibacter nanhaiisediminis]TWI57130.1 two-component system NtrC family response regulator [Halalkalibacter nanhaiisediminis]